MKRILAATLLILFATALAFGQCSEADRQKLIAFDKAWGEASERGDRAFLQNIYADDYLNLSLAGTLTKARAIENAARAAERRKADPQNADRISHDNYIVTCTPNTATITHRNVITAKVNGKEENFYTRSVHFLEKRGNDWKVVSDAGGALNDGGQVLYMEMAWTDASKRKDAAWLERNYAEDYTFVAGDGSLNDKKADIDSLKDLSLDSAELSDMNVRVDGDVAVVTGINTLKGKFKNQDISGTYRFTDTFIKRDGEWKILATQSTRIAQPQTAQR